MTTCVLIVTWRPKLQLLADTLIILRGPTQSAAWFVYEYKDSCIVWQRGETQKPLTSIHTVRSSVPEPQVFGPLGSGSASQRYESGSGSFYHQANIVRKTWKNLDSYCFTNYFGLFNLWKNDVNEPSKSNQQKPFLQLFFCWCLEVQWQK